MNCHCDWRESRVPLAAFAVRYGTIGGTRGLARILSLAIWTQLARNGIDFRRQAGSEFPAGTRFQKVFGYFRYLLPQR